MEASLTCAVCLALFENPVTLPVCSHNFCRSCVDECLSQASLPALSAVASSRSAPRSYDPLRTSRRGGGGSVSVSCPLCRKLCPLPADLGAAALPVNTTLAELVKLFKAAKPSQGATPEEASSALAPHLAALGVACEKHPGRLMQLYCRMCRRGGCGQCVSEEHRGVFHSVNLIDTVYQEEKLAFFSNLKKIRELHLTLKKEITVPQIEAETHEKELIETEFEKVHNALEMRKKQLLEDLDIRRTRKEKENLVWKKTKEAHRKTIENVLTDCEKLLDECDPQRFLEVACSLNQRMITQLDLIQLSSDQDESQPECKQMQIDTTSLVKDILALNLTSVNSDAAKETFSRGSQLSIFQSPGSKWEAKKNIQNTFCPVEGEDILPSGRHIATRFMSISATTDFSMSPEEVRYNYYMKHQMYSDKLQAQTLLLNERYTQPKLRSSKNATLEVIPSCLSTKGNNQKKMRRQLLQRKAVKETSPPDLPGFSFKTQAMNFNFSGSNNNFNLLNVQGSQKDSKETFPSERTKSCFEKDTVLALPTVTLPSETIFSFTMFPNISQPTALPSANLSPYVKCNIMESQTPVPVSSSSGNMMVVGANKSSPMSVEKYNSVSSTLFLVKSKSQECNIKNNANGYDSVSTTAINSITTTTSSAKPAGSGNLLIPAFSTNLENDCFQTTKPNFSEQTSCSVSLPIQKTEQGKTDTCFNKESTPRCSWLTSAEGCPKHLVDDSNTICSYASDKQTVPCVTVPDHSCINNAPNLFSFKGCIKNSCGTFASSIIPCNKTECAHEKTVKATEKNSTAKKSVPLRNDVPFYQEMKDLMCHSSSFSVSEIRNCLKSETDNVLVSQQPVGRDPLANSTSVSAVPTDVSSPLENAPTHVEDHRRSPSVTSAASCTVNSDSDVEDLSQASNSSDSSIASEYFCLAEDKILPR